jgi:DNA repair exonuclease SbcCD ATPase subunit
VNTDGTNIDELLTKIQEYLQLTTDLVQKEQAAALSELTRMEDILHEASEELRGSFTEIDKLFAQDLTQQPRSNSLVKLGEEDNNTDSIKSKLSKQYRRSITALQFEDIVKQIIGHSKTRGRGIDEILKNISSRAHQLDTSRVDLDQLQQAIEDTRSDIRKFQEKMAATNPVIQTSLDSGDIELF